MRPGSASSLKSIPTFPQMHQTGSVISTKSGTGILIPLSVTSYQVLISAPSLTLARTSTLVLMGSAGGATSCPVTMHGRNQYAYLCWLDNFGIDLSPARPGYTWTTPPRRVPCTLELYWVAIKQQFPLLLEMLNIIPYIFPSVIFIILLDKDIGMLSSPLASWLFQSVRESSS